MSYFRHGDPEDDFDRLDAKQAAYYARLPKCDECETTIEDEFYYDFAGVLYCEDCLNAMCRKSTHDYTEVDWG